jgi:hypothetical protein
MRWFERVLACSPGTNSIWVSVQAYSVKATAQWQLQQTNAARASLTSAMELADRQSSKLPSDGSGAQWLERIYAEALIREAKAAINSTTTGGRL